MATAQRDYYDLLGVSRSATPDDIKKAFRRLARQFHPDLHAGARKGEMENKFKGLNEAYEVLSDPESRKKYDRYGHQWEQAEAYERAQQQSRGAGVGDAQWPQGGQAGAGADFSDIFESFFGGGRRRGGGPGSEGSGARGEDLITSVRLSLREVISGVTQRIQLTEPVPCRSCQGTGRVSRRPCPECAGAGRTPDTRMIDVKIPAGIQDGKRIRVPGKGAPAPNGGRRGDLFLNVEVAKHPVFAREGADLDATLPVWPWEAALGAEVTAPTLGDPIKVRVPAGSQSGNKLRIKGKGLPADGGTRGDLYFVLQIILPSPLSEDERRQYEEMAKAARPDPRGDLIRKAGQ
ncbi:MAG: J domain-containing protein [Nitrospira sp.]|nr:MAG: J domain-containing protein [Nitrospira sp.]